MAARSAERAPPFIDPPGYARHRPEHTLLYHIIEQHYPGESVRRRFSAERRETSPRRATGHAVSPRIRTAS